MPSAPLIVTNTTPHGGDMVDAILNGWEEATGSPLTDLRVANQISNLRSIGEMITGSRVNMNMFMEQLVNRIAFVILTSKMYTNPWSQFKRGILEYGETIEEIFVQLVKPFNYESGDVDTNPFQMHKGDIKTAFHTLNYMQVYPSTINEQQLKQAFLSFSGMTNLVTGLIQQIYTSANYDEFLMMKYMIAKLYLDGQIPVVIEVPAPDDTVPTARKITKEYVLQAKLFQYMSDKYTMGGVKTVCYREDIRLLISAFVETALDVDSLAVAFNIDKATLMGRQVQFDSFDNLDFDRLDLLLENDPHYVNWSNDPVALQNLADIQAVMCDANFFMIFDNLAEMTDIYNPRQMYWNYFYHTWKTFSVSPYCNVAIFVNE